MIRYIVSTIEFELQPVQTIDFSISPVRTLLFDFENVTIGADTHAHYEGEYVITPHAYEQSLETEDKVCDDDITILTIPMAKVTNIQGGYTATIG